MTLADAITRQENTPASWNNPGALTAAPSRYCQVGKVNGIVEFCTPADGQAALDNQLQIYANQGVSLQQLINKWAPADNGVDPMLAGNNPGVYASNVSGWLGVDPNTPVADLMNLSFSGNSAGGNNTYAPDTVAPGFDMSNLSNGMTEIFTNSDGSTNWMMVGIVGIVGVAVLNMTLGD